MKKTIMTTVMALLVGFGNFGGSVSLNAENVEGTTITNDTAYVDLENKVAKDSVESKTKLEQKEANDKRFIKPEPKKKVSKQSKPKAQSKAKKSETPQSKSKAKKNVKNVLTMEATAYTAYCTGCSGITRTGINLKANPNQKVIAVDPNVIPLGTKVYVEGYGTAIAGDTGGDIKGNRIDLFIPGRQDALNFGRKTVKVQILG